MTSPNLLNSSQLLELAALDAFGLLDEYEADQFTRSFHHAPATVQREIVRVQAEIAADTQLLPDDAPAPELRQRVLAAVADAVEQRSSTFAPLATIGRSDASRADARRDGWRALSPLLWRAATFTLVGVTVVLMYFLVATLQHANMVTQLALVNVTSDQLRREIGPDFTEFLSDPRVTRIVLQPVDETRDELWAVVMVNDTTGEAFLVCNGLSDADGNYSISAIRTDDQSRHELRRFESTGSIYAARMDISDIASPTQVSWEITGPDGRRVLFA